MATSISFFPSFLPILLLLFPLIFHSPVSAISLGIGRQQSAGVKGQLVCDGKPLAGVKVKLYDDDRGKFGADLGIWSQ
jgi:hypothetical protein